MTMGFLRDLRSDLVEKRLWPVALLLVAALVAVPLVLAKSPSSGGGGQAPEPLPAPAATGAPVAGEPAVSVTSATPDGAPLRGHAKDPFRQQHLAPKAAGAPGAPVGGATTPAGSGSSGAGGSPGAAHPGKPAKKVYVTASIDVRFGKAAGTLRTIRDVPRLTPLPHVTNPIAIFLGMRSDEQTAVFLISTDVHAQGDGRCTPSVKTCEAIELKANETAFLDVTAADGSVTQYELDLVKVTLKRTTSKAKAQAAYARASHAGAHLLRRRTATSAVASALRYSPLTGVLDAVPSTFLSALTALQADDQGAPQAVAGVRHEGWIVPIP